MRSWIFTIVGSSAAGSGNWSSRRTSRPVGPMVTTERVCEKGRDKVVYLDGLPAIGLVPLWDFVFHSEPRHGRDAAQALSQRSDRRPVDPVGTDVASPDPGGGPAPDRLSGGPQRDLLSPDDGVC